MKVKLEIDPDASEDELIIKAKNISPEMEQLYRKLQNIEHEDQIECFKDNVSYYLPLNKILFFETDAKQVILHTQDRACLDKHNLYELENILANFSIVLN